MYIITCTYESLKSSKKNLLIEVKIIIILFKSFHLPFRYKIYVVQVYS